MCILFPKIMMGMISWWCCVFFYFLFLIKILNLCNVPYEVLIMLTNFFFFFFFGLYFSPEVYLVCFHCTATCGAPSFLLGHNQPSGMLLEKTWVQIQLKTLPLRFNLINCGKSTNPGQCWSQDGGGVTC